MFAFMFSPDAVQVTIYDYVNPCQSILNGGDGTIRGMLNFVLKHGNAGHQVECISMADVHFPGQWWQTRRF